MLIDGKIIKKIIFKLLKNFYINDLIFSIKSVKIEDSWLPDRYRRRFAISAHHHLSIFIIRQT